jgi:uncharacterized protein (PEP-CTERM system associated)
MGLALTLAVAPVGADPLIASAGVMTRLVYTDNLFLTVAGKEAAPIFQLLPNITAGRQGSHGSFRLYYGPSALFYGGGYSELDSVFHVLQANANMDVVKDYVSLQFTASANQNLISPVISNAGFTALGNPGAFAQTASVGVTPVFQFPLVHRSFAVVRFAPGVNYVFTSKTATGDSNAGSSGINSSLRVTSGDAFSRLRWELAGNTNLYNQDTVNSRSANQNTGTSNLNLTLIYPFSVQWRVEGLTGYEWSQYDSVYSSLEQPQGWRWRITPYWNPSPNTSVGLGYGWRYFGADYFANIRYLYRKTALTLSYESTVSSARTALLDTNVVNFQDPYGAPITNPLQTQTLSGSIANPALRSGLFVQRQLLLTLAHQFGRNYGLLSLNTNHWDYVDSQNVVDDVQGTLSLSRSLSARATGRVGMQYWKYDQSEIGAVDFSQYQAWTELSYQLSRRTTGDVRYSYTQRSSDYPDQDFDENSVWLTINWGL